MLRTTINRKVILSDHMPFLIKTPTISLVGWNLLSQMSYSPEKNFFNNGFACKNESAEQYRNRLSHISTQLNSAVEKYRPHFICMQECPLQEEFRTYFLASLKEKNDLNEYQIQLHKEDKSKNDLITLYDRKNFTLLSEPSETLSKLAFTEGLKSRILPLVFSHNETKENLLILNVHANFAKKIKNDLKILLNLVSQLNVTNIIILGDFNRDLVLKSDDYSEHDIAESLDENKCFEKLYVCAVRDSSFCSKFNTETKGFELLIETRDGCISTHPAKVEHLSEILVQNAVLSYTNALDSRLSAYPNNLFQTLSVEKKEDNEQSTINLIEPRGSSPLIKLK